MDTEKLLAALAAKADRVVAPIPVTIPDVGTLYVRAVTIEEYEKLEASEGSAIAAGLARSLCDESGARLTKEVAERFAAEFVKQPTEVMHALLAGVRGEGDKKTDSGN